MPLNEDSRTFVEESSGQYTATFKDESDTAVALTSIDSISLTLYDKYSGEIINSRNAQDVLNTNNVTYHATSGLLTWAIQQADNIIVGLVDHLGIGHENDDVDWLEEHIALFDIVYNTDLRAIHEVKLLVKNIGIIEQSSSSSSSVSSSSSSSLSSVSSSSSSSQS